MKKVFYYKGDNLRNDYFIKAEKKKVTITKDSLAFKLDNDENIYIINEPQLFTSNFDYVLEEIDKTTNKSKFISCHSEDINI